MQEEILIVGATHDDNKNTPTSARVDSPEGRIISARLDAGNSLIQLGKLIISNRLHIASKLLEIGSETIRATTEKTGGKSSASEYDHKKSYDFDERMESRARAAEQGSDKLRNFVEESKNKNFPK